MPLIDAIAQAIGKMEGFGAAGTLATRNHNPGNLRPPRGVTLAGQTGTDINGFAIFPDDQTGWSALDGQIQRNITGYPDLSLYTFFAGQRNPDGSVIPGGYPGYAPSADSNNPTNYAQFVGTQAGIDPAAPLADLFAGITSPAPDFGGDPTLSDFTDESGVASLSMAGWTALGLSAALVLWVALS